MYVCMPRLLFLSFFLLMVWRLDCFHLCHCHKKGFLSCLSAVLVVLVAATKILFIKNIFSSPSYIGIILIMIIIYNFSFSFFNLLFIFPKTLNLWDTHTVYLCLFCFLYCRLESLDLDWVFDSIIMNFWKLSRRIWWVGLFSQSDSSITNQKKGWQIVTHN